MFDSTMWLTRFGLWPLRILWFLLPLACGYGFSDLLERHSGPVSLVAEAGLWIGWFAGLVALGAPSSVSLSTIRLLSPAILGALVVGLAADGGSGAGVARVAIAGLYGLLVAIVVFSPWVGDQLVNGSAYGNERRMALRPPASLLIGPIQVAWLVVFLGVISGPLLLAGNHYVLGLLATFVGGVLAWRGAVSLHQLARRWVVFVPAGFVLHDYYHLAESLLMQRRDIDHLGPAPLDVGQLLDISGGSKGLALLVELKKSTPVALRAAGKQVQSIEAQRVVFTPSLPGVLIQEARARNITIDAS